MGMLSQDRILVLKCVIRAFNTKIQSLDHSEPKYFFYKIVIFQISS